MKRFLLLILTLSILSSLQAQDKETKWYAIDKNELLTMGLEMTAGYVQGWREEVLYHPNELFRRFPNLNRNFWDNRISWQKGNILDANHVGKAIITGLHIFAVVVRVNEKNERWKDKVVVLRNYMTEQQLRRTKFKFIANKLLTMVVDFGKHYVAYQVGFFLSYNVTHQNKVWGK